MSKVENLNKSLNKNFESLNENLNKKFVENFKNFEYQNENEGL
jgi:hypothetical protein